MDRRTFLKLIGATAAVAAIEPGRVIAATKATPQAMVTRYPLVTSCRPDVDLWCSGFVLPAPAHQLQRAVFEMTRENEEKFWASPHGVAVFNEPEQIVVSRVAHGDEPSMLMTEIDAAVMSFEGGPVPVDWGVISRERDIALDYRGLGQGSDELYLALFYSVHRRTSCPGSGLGPLTL